MLKIIEVKEELDNSTLVDNVYEIHKMIQHMIQDTEYITEINKNDYNYLNIVMGKTKNNLEKIKYIFEKNKQKF
jgi:hypothetical protein